MIIDDAYAGMKDKYFEKAQTKTGVLSGVVKSLNDFVKKYDSAKQTMNSDMQELKQTYVYNSAPFELKHMEIFNTFNDAVAQIREESKEQIQNIIQQVRDKVSAIIASDLPEGTMNDITMIKVFAGTLSDDEIKVYLNKYKHNYLATKAIFNAMAEGQADRLCVEFVTVKNISDSIDSIEEMAMNMIRTSVISIDTQIQTDANDNLTIGDCLADSVDIEGDAVENDCKNRIWCIVDDILNDKQKDVITSYFMNQQTYSAIGETMGCSRERIRQIKEKALSILKEIKELQDLAEFWGYDSMMAYTGKNSVEYLVLKKLEYEEMIQKKTAQFENTMLAITKNQQAYIVERIEELCREKHISKRQLEREAGLGTGSITKWNQFRPRKASLQRVADYFGVELEFLIGNSKQNQEEVS